MKKFFCLIGCIVFLCSFAQKGTHFTKEVNYIIPNYYGDSTVVNTYLTPEFDLALIESKNTYGTNHYVMYQGDFFYVDVDIMKRIKIKKLQNSYSGNSDVYFTIVNEELLGKIKKTKETEVVNTVSSAQYILPVYLERSDNEEELELYVAENHAINNMKVLGNSSKTKIKGLITKIQTANTSRPLVYISHGEVDFYVDIDIKATIKEMIQQKKEQEKTQSKLDEYYNELQEKGKLGNTESSRMSEYRDEFLMPEPAYELTQEAADAVDEAVEAVGDAAYDYYDYKSYDYSYESAYKDLHIDNLNLDVYMENVNMYKEEFTHLPDYCSQQTSIELEDKEYQKYMMDYISLVCYQYNSSYYNNFEKMEIDAMRYLVNYLLNNHNTLSTSDQKKVKQFLTNLD